ncbi:MAG: alpha-ketoacid dehydrogenase subunit beta, partial [Acidimicrobiia bacterium]|nr:alpha-ketoacid dehydrogenase subunit beta [Acidimicrobiia bacterium]
DNVSFGVGAEVAAFVAEEAFYDLDCPIRRLAMPDVPAMPFAAPMEAAVSVGPEAVVAAIRDMAAH